MATGTVVAVGSLWSVPITTRQVPWVSGRSWQDSLGELGLTRQLNTRIEYGRREQNLPETLTNEPKPEQIWREINSSGATCQN